MLSEDQHRAIEKVATEHGFRNFSVSSQSGSKKGDNYLGNIFLITVREKDGTKEKSLILKCALENEIVRAQIPINDCYKREVYLYTSVLPAFEKLQEKYPVPVPFKAFAKMYGFSLKEGKEWLLLQNITTYGFGMLNRKKTMDGYHVSRVVKELGKLHSLSFVMKQFEPNQYKEFSSNLRNYFHDYPHIAKSWTEGIQKKFKNAYKALQGSEEAIEKLKNCEKSLNNFLEKKEENEEYSVITHGDAWCNNIMFKYDDPGKPSEPTELCFLDWQISTANSPMADICYFLFLSASKEVLNNYRTYLDEYYQVLTQNLSAVGLDVQTVLPHNIFEDHWIRYCKVELYVVMGMINNLLQDEKDAKTFSDMAETGGDIMKAFSEQGGIQNEESYRRLRDIILMLVENKYL